MASRKRPKLQRRLERKSEALATADSARRKGVVLVTTHDHGRYELTDVGLALVQQLARDGHPDAAIAEAIGINRDTLRALRDRDKRVKEALARGKAANEGELVNLLQEQARAGNITAAIFLLKARHGYREGTERGEGQSANIVINLPGARSPEDWTPPIDVGEGDDSE